jgi:hypothetical protein
MSARAVQTFATLRADGRTVTVTRYRPHVPEDPEDDCRPLYLVEVPEGDYRRFVSCFSWQAALSVAAAALSTPLITWD